jgi:hypothetical protein
MKFDLCDFRKMELELDASSRGSSEISDWKDLCTAVDCGELMIMMMIHKKLWCYSGPHRYKDPRSLIY